MHRADDEAETVLRRLVVYQEQTEPLIAWYRESDAQLVDVDAARPVDEVQRSFRKAVGKG